MVDSFEFCSIYFSGRYLLVGEVYEINKLKQNDLMLKLTLENRL